MTEQVEKEMPYEEREACFKIRCASKSGSGMSREDLRKCKRWMKLYPRQYREMSAEVFEATKPFGAK